MVRAMPCQGIGCEFESHHPLYIQIIKNEYKSYIKYIWLDILDPN